MDNTASPSNPTDEGAYPSQGRSDRARTPHGWSVPGLAILSLLVLFSSAALPATQELPIQCGVPLVNTIVNPLDIHLLRFQVPEDEIVNINVVAAPSSGTDFDPAWRLLDGQGMPAAACGTNRFGQGDCGPLPADENYRLHVQDFFSDETGTYRVAVNFLITGCPTATALTLRLSGCTTCRAGDRFIVQSRIINTSTTATPIEAKIGVRAPDGTPINLVGRHLEISLDPGVDVTVSLLDLEVPPGLPPGTWTFEGTLLEPELGKTLSRHTQPFEVLP